MKRIKSTKFKAHTIYKDPNGKRIPGVTTILGLRNKPQLIKWANNLGLQGIDTSKYVNEMALIGTLAHTMVENDCSPEITIPYENYSKDQIDLAKNAFLKWQHWRKTNDFRPIKNEIKLTGGGGLCKKLYFGGTIDIYCDLNGTKTLLDIKTSKACYAEHYMQVAAYKHLLEVNNFDVENVRILRIGREKSEGFEDIKVSNIDKYFRIFVNLLEIYYIEKSL